VFRVPARLLASVSNIENVLSFCVVFVMVLEYCVMLCVYVCALLLL